MKPDTCCYKETGGHRLDLHVFRPASKAGRRCAGIVFFHGGGWSGGSPGQFFPHCRHFASRGMVAVSAMYRLGGVHGATPADSVCDAKSAMRWVRAHAKALGIDPARLAAGGGSAGGHLAAATALCPGFDDPADDVGCSPRPCALVLFNPVLDNAPGQFGHECIQAWYPAISPAEHVSASAPPTVFFLGTADDLIPVATAERFQRRMRDAGVRCDLHLYEGEGHGFFNYGRTPDHACFRDTVGKADAFLVSLGLLDGEPDALPGA
jgi:acetyl esterase/lipase